MKRETVITLVLIFISSFTEPRLADAQTAGDTSDESLNISFKKIHEWSITNPMVIPLPFDAQILVDGTVVIVDRGLHTINHFDRDGNLISTFGGEGRGPGEYQNISAVAIRDDGKVAVADISSAAITVSDVYSEQRHRTRIDPGWSMALQWSGDTLVFSSHPFKIMGGNRGDIIMTRFDSELQSSEQLMRLELQRDDPPEDQISCMFCRFWFREDLTYYTTPNDHRYLAYFVTPQTGESFKISREEIEPEEFSDQELEQIAEQRREASSRAGIEFENNDLPRFKRMIVDMFIDHNDRLWIQRHSTGGTSTIYDLFNQDREFLGSVTPPVGVGRILSVSGDRVLFSVSGADNDPDTWRAAVFEISEN